MGVFLGYDLSEGCPGQFYRAVCELLQQFLYCIGVGWDKVFTSTISVIFIAEIRIGCKYSDYSPDN